MDSPRSPDTDVSSSPPPSSDAAVDSPPETVSKVASSIRFLISNVAAGSVIGKGGVTISEFQSQSGARIQLSRNHEYFPGTSDRIIALSGTVKEVLSALHLILSKILNEIENEDGRELKTNQIKLLVPNSVCGAIIGKGGATIKSFVENSNANIKLSPLEQTISGLNDRVVTVTGTLEQQLRAVALIVTKLSEDPSYNQYASMSFPYAGAATSVLGLRGRLAATTLPSGGYGGTPYLSSGGNGSFRSKGLMPPLVPVPTSPGQVSVPLVPASPTTTSVTLAVPDEHVGAVVGRGGKTITDIQQTSGVRIKISDRGDFIPGTTDRKVVITGTADGVRMAKQLVTQKLHQSLNSDFER